MYLHRVNPSCTSWQEEHHNYEQMGGCKEAGAWLLFSLLRGGGGSTPPLQQALHKDAGTPRQQLPHGAQNQQKMCPMGSLRGMSSRWLMMSLWVLSLHRLPWLHAAPSESWSREGLGKRRTGPLLIYRLVLTQSAVGVWFVLPVILLPLLLCTAGASILAVALRVVAPLPGQPVEPKEHEQDISRDPKPPLMEDSKEHTFLGKPRRLLASQLPFLPQLSHLLLLLLCILLQEVLRGRVGGVTHPQLILQDAQHGQHTGNAESHGLEEEGEKGLSGAGWERDGAVAAGTRDRGAQGLVGEGVSELRGSKGQVGEPEEDRDIPSQAPGRLPWLGAPGTSVPRPEESSCPAQGTPHSTSTLPPVLETRLGTHDSALTLIQPSLTPACPTHRQTAAAMLPSATPGDTPL